MKQYKKLINAMILVVLISIISFFVYAYTLPACCCYPGGEYGYVQNPDQVEICEVGGGTAMGDNVMDSLDCVGICGVTMCDNCKYGLCSHYENCEDNLDGGTCSHLGEGYSCCSGNCTLQEGACNVPGLNVGIINLQRGNDRGYRQITLNWNSNLCPAGSYEIFRCEGSSCTPTLSVGLTTTTTFADKDINWDKVYSYKVKGYYLYQGEKDAVINNVYSGNLECENQITSDRFCIHHPSYYQNEPYVSYIYGEGININGEEYSSKDNKHFFCSSSNLLSGETACQGGNICVGGECIIPSECVDVTNNPLGMYYSIGLCEGTIVDSKYCFLDKSEKNVDNCYPCSPDMKCYDYRTEEACERDNCNAGSCSWRETSSDLGTGVCIDLDKDNCALCNAFGTTGMENINTFNFVFDIYTLEKLDALSTSEYPCFKYQGECTSCGDIGCPVYSTQTECSQLGTSAVSLDNTNNIINPGGDSCGIDVCQWKSGKCVKNADGLSPKDCREDIENCEKDYFRPVATLTPIMTQGGVSSFTITVTDKASKSDPESIKYGYETYWCVYSGTDNCRYLDGGSGRASYEKFTTGTTLALRGGESDLRLCSGTDNCMDLVLGENILKHYSIDPAGNLGVVEDITFIASPGSVVPSVVNASIIGGNFVEGIYYTTNHNPIIYVEFVGSAQFISKVLTDIDGTPFGTQGGEGMAEVHQIEPSTLPNNNYIFTFSAENEYGRSMVNNYDLNFVVDSISPTLTIIPDGVVDTSSVSVNLSFSEKVFLDSVFIDGVNTTDEFKTTDNTLFRCTFSFNDGDHNIIVVAHDYAGNSVTSSGIFGVNADPSLRIEMAEPSYGVSPVYDFTIKLKTDNDAECKYTFNPLNIEALSYNTMTGFTTISGGKEHIKEHFTTIRAPDEINTFYVKCKDLYDDSITSKSFELSVDDTPPSFELAIADPDIVVTDPAYTDLKVRTDDYAVCDYTSLVDGTEGVFSSSGEGKYGFGKANYAEIILESTQTRNYNYSVTCMNKAELSSTTLIGFRVDRTSDMSITDLTDDYFNSTTVRLEIGNNLGSQCRYSPDNSLWAYFSQVPDTTRYFASVTVSGAGEHTYYVQCYRNGLWDPEQPVTISFTVDNTAPKMILVNSTSNCNNESLRAMWAAEEDSYSRVRGYSYSVYKSQTSKTIKNWTDAGSDSDEWQIIDNLDLIMGESYYIKVKAYNILDAYSTEMSSKKVTIDDSNCDNIIPNGDECSNSIDCLSGFCNPETKKCATPTCNDGYDNGDESDVDCGGDCDKCEDGKRCDNKDSNCESGNCDVSTGRCAAADSCENGKLDIGTETDIDCGNKCDACEAGRFCEVNDDCQEGLICFEGVCNADGDKDGIIDTADNCPDTYNPEQEDMDSDGIGDACDDDTDEDGLPDDWEIDNDLDPYNPDTDGNGINDGDEDWDNDGLTNRKEYQYGTNPSNRDTDGDGVDDKTEIEKGTDPLDPNSKPKSGLILILLIMIILGILGAGAYFGYPYYKDNLEKILVKSGLRKEVKKPGAVRPVTAQPRIPTQPYARPVYRRQMPVKPMIPRREEKLRNIIEERKRKKHEERLNIFSAFGGKEAPKERVIEKKARTIKRAEPVKEKTEKMVPSLKPSKKPVSMRKMPVKEAIKTKKEKDVFGRLRKMARKKDVLRNRKTISSIKTQNVLNKKEESFKKLKKVVEKKKTALPKKQYKKKKGRIR